MTAARQRLVGTLPQPEVPDRNRVARVRERPWCQASIDLVALPSAVTVARLFVASTLRRWGAGFVEPELGSVAAELVALGVDETGPGTTDWAEIRQLNPMIVNLVGYPAHILVEVFDVHPYRIPVPDAERSLTPVVDALSSRRGAYPMPRGRVMWAEVAVCKGAAVVSGQRIRALPAVLRPQPEAGAGA